MDALPIYAALGASTTWAIAAIIAYSPTRSLGAFTFVKIQVLSCSILVLSFCFLTDRFNTIDWGYWPAYLVSGVVGVLITNISLSVCVRRGGPRRAALLSTSKALFAAVISFAFLGEKMSIESQLGCIVVTIGIIVAIVLNKPHKNSHVLESIDGSISIIIGTGLLAGFSQAIGILALKKPILEGLDPIMAAGIRLSVCSVAIICFDILRQGPILPKLENNKVMALVAILPGFMGYVVAAGLLLYAVGQRNSAEMFILSSLSPILIIPFQWIITRQNIGLGVWLGTFLVVVGTYLLVKS